MLAHVALALGALQLAWAISTYWSFSKNLVAAKASGIPYIKTPIYMLNVFWLITHRLWISYIRKLPTSWTYPWLDVIDIHWTYYNQYAIFKDLGVDTFLTVSPGMNMLWTADANVISQITTRRNDFPKPTHMYGPIDIYGKNVVTTEGALWRQHRKVTGPPFTEKNNHLVWQESLHQAQAMLDSWLRPSELKVRTISTLSSDAMRLSLYVISRAGFGVQLQWPGAEAIAAEKADDSKGFSATCISEGHTMTYTDAIQTLLHNLNLVLIAPKFLLRNIPIKFMNKAYESYIEWGKYMEQMFQAKLAEIGAGNEERSLDLMAALVKSAGVPVPSVEKQKQSLTSSEIMGNSFIFMLAGHETVANSIHFSLVYLAMNPASQRRLQADLDSIFQGRAPSEWEYETDFPKLFAGMAGAVLAEELRLLPPVTNIPKYTLPDSPQPLMVNGQEVTVPGNTVINLCASIAHRNPKFWPSGTPSDPLAPVHPTSNIDNDLEEFKPERWFITEPKFLSTTTTNPLPNGSAKGYANGHANGPANGYAKPNPNGHCDRKLAAVVIQESTETNSLAINTAADTAHTLYRPPSGSYLPFSEGYRACLGRRFAQVEALAVLAVIFSQYSIELAVDQWASDEEVETMGTEARNEVWMKARRRARWLLTEKLESVITLQLRSDVVPLRIVRRGSERFT